jgi:hypothetical protein
MDWSGSGSGGSGDWGNGKEQRARESWGGDGQQEEVPGSVRLRLGKKIVMVPLAQQSRHEDRDYDVTGEQEIQLGAVSLWTSSAKGVVPLV